MNPNEELITKFYTAFQTKDGVTMANSYTADASFSDPVFKDLKGKEVGAMWLMLVEKSQNLTIRFLNVHADDVKGSADWEADYSFSKTGRMVNNKIHAEFTFQDGKIKTHLDKFSLWKWTAMAMGPVGTFLGWLPTIQNKVKTEAMTGLTLYMKRKESANLRVAYFGISDSPPAFVTSLKPKEIRYDLALPLLPPDAQ